MPSENIKSPHKELSLYIPKTPGSVLNKIKNKETKGTKQVYFNQ